jgi:integrase/recombinase XerD
VCAVGTFRPGITQENDMPRARDLMLDELRLRNAALATQKEYLRCATLFAEGIGVPPLRATREIIRAFLATLTTKGVHVSTLKMFIAAIRFLYINTLDRPELVEWIPWPKTPKRLPEILSPEEVDEILRYAPTLLAWVTISLAYGTGLRLAEVCHLQAKDIVSDRHVIHVHDGKGSRDRLVPLTDPIIQILRDWWRFRKPQGTYIFPAARGKADCISDTTIQSGFHHALRDAGIQKKVTFHSLRHAYATHQLENGVDIVSLRALLGHATLSTTMIYLHVRADRLAMIGSPLDVLPSKKTAALQ